MGLVLCGGAQANETDQPPAFDAVAVCEMEWDARLPDSRVADCVDRENAARSYLKVVYSAVAPATRRRCEESSRANTRGLGSSAYLKTCIGLAGR